MRTGSPHGELAVFSFGNGDVPKDLTPRELQLTAILYTKLGADDVVRTTGRLPDHLGGNWNWVPMNVVMRERGADAPLTLAADEQLVHDAILREGRLPGGAVRLVRTRSEEEIAQADKNALEFEKDLPCYYDDGIIPAESEDEDSTHSRSEGWGFYGYFRPHKPQASPAPATPVTGRRKRSGAPKRRRRA